MGLWSFLLSLIRYGNFYSPAQGGIQAGTGVKTLLAASGSIQEVTAWGQFEIPCRKVGGFQFGSQQVSTAQKTSLAKLCKFRKVFNVKNMRIQQRSYFNYCAACKDLNHTQISFSTSLTFATWVGNFSFALEIQFHLLIPH